jgi:hypothetical protein
VRYCRRPRGSPAGVPPARAEDEMGPCQNYSSITTRGTTVERPRIRSGDISAATQDLSAATGEGKMPALQQLPEFVPILYWQAA